MSNELVVIEEGTALQVLSKKEGVELLIEDVRKRVMSLDGGSMKTGVGRKKIRSNAFQATKAKTKINEKHIQPLIDGITNEIQPQLDTIKALKDNRKVLNEGLDRVRKDVNSEVDALEAVIAEEAEAKKRLAEWDDAISENKAFDDRLAHELEIAHMEALLDNIAFDKAVEEAVEHERLRLEAE